jgi:hypothetical protein
MRRSDHCLMFKIYRDGKEIGSYSAEEMIRLRLNGTLKETDFYWHEGMADRAPMMEGGMWEQYSLFHQPKGPKYFEACFLLHGALMTSVVWIIPIYLSFSSSKDAAPFSRLFWERLELLFTLSVLVLLADWVLAMLVRAYCDAEYFRRLFHCESWGALLFQALLILAMGLIIYTASAYFFDFFGRDKFFNGGGYDDGLYRR